jgi:SAM-dependent methyltransferase
MMANRLVKDIIQWDIKSWSTVLGYWDKEIDWDKTKIGLELGSREGGLTLWLALKNVLTICSDLKDSKKIAEPLHKKYEVASKVIYQDIDATDIPYENYFDIIVFKSIIGGIGRNKDSNLQRKVFIEAHRALKKGGKLVFAENLNASLLHQKVRRRFVKWDYWNYPSIKELEYYLKDFFSYELKTTGFLATLGRSEMQKSFLTSVDNLILNKITPNNWKYIAYGIAEK